MPFQPTGPGGGQEIRGEEHPPAKSHTREEEDTLNLGLLVTRQQLTGVRAHSLMEQNLAWAPPSPAHTRPGLVGMTFL